MCYKKILYLFLVALIFTACSEYPVPVNVSPEPSYKSPDSITPRYVFKDDWKRKTIKEIRDTNPSTIPLEIKEKIFIKGIVTADDESGNLYKKVYIQDETAGIELSIDRVNLYNIMPRGQEVIVELKGMFVGQFLSAYQVGDSATHLKYGYQMSRYDWNKEYANKHYYCNGRPNLNLVPKSEIIKSAKDIKEEIHDGKLVTFENVSFPEAGAGIFWNKKEESNGHSIIFNSDNSTNPEGVILEIIVGGYSNFYTDLLPVGSGSITGILSTRRTPTKTQYQLFVRDRNDIQFNE